MSIPSRDELDPATLTALLRSSGHLDDSVAVRSATFSPLGTAGGMMSEVMRCTLAYDGATSAPTSVIVKTATTDEHRRFVATAGQLYQREISFYTHIAQDAPVRVPKCVYAAMDHETNDFLLILEDVGHQRSIDQVAGVDVTDAFAAIKLMAQWHARWWGRDLNELSKHFFAWNGEFNKAAFPMVFGSNWDTAKEVYGSRLPADIVAFGDGFVERSGDILDGLMGPDTLVHSDFRADNLLFDGDTPMLLDFQMLSVGCGLVDFGFFMSQSLSTATRQAHFDELLSAYLSELNAHGIELTREVALDKYRRVLGFGLAWPVGLAGSFAKLDDRSQSLALSMLDRFVQAMVEANAVAVYES
jgi:aminoglycoside/choline kinase family phosphotransferase